MYYEYWGLTKPAFDNVPDPSMYVECHASMENAMAETLFAIEEGDDCIAVIIGDVGLGKTMTLRMIIDSLPQEKYKIALITNPGISFVQILQEIIGQLTGQQCEEKRKVNLLEIFNSLLFATLSEGKKVLVFIDEANAITPVNLESLRLLTNMQGDRRNLFTMVLAGQMEFARRLEHPKRANLFQRVGTYNRIEKLEDAATVRKYVETRLRLAGAETQIFTDTAFCQLWEYSDHGVPRLINKLAKLCLKAGETNGFTCISEEVVEQIGARFHSLAGPAVAKRRSRKRLVDTEAATMEASPSASINLPDEIAEIDEPTVEISEEIVSTRSKPAILQDENAVVDKQEEAITAAVLPVAPDFAPVEPEGHLLDFPEELYIGDIRIKINIPENVMSQPRSYTREHRFKLAGALAAETLQGNPNLIASPLTDPVPIWQEIRDFVLDRMERAGNV